MLLRLRLLLAVIAEGALVNHHVHVAVGGNGGSQSLHGTTVSRVEESEGRKVSEGADGVIRVLNLFVIQFSSLPERTGTRVHREGRKRQIVRQDTLPSHTPPNGAE